MLFDLFKRRCCWRLASSTILLLSLSLSTNLYAATGNIVQTWPGPVSSIFGNDSCGSTGSCPEWGYPNLPVPSDGASYNEGDNPAGEYRVNLNFWNEDTFGGALPTTSMTINVEDQSGAFTVIQSGNSYYANGRPHGDCTPSSTSTEDPCRWTPNQVHAPSSYPSIYNGCHWNQCTQSGDLRDGTTVRGAPYPIQVSQITGIPSHWIVDTTNERPDSIYNVAYDIWLDRNLSGVLPTSPEDVNQNDGLEIMIWMNHRGYNDVPGNTALGGVIQPIGNRVITDYVFPQGISGVWDVWVTTESKAGGEGAEIQWFVVSYIRKDPVDDFQFDSKWFIEHAQTLDCFGGEKCADPSWWLTSIQSGFEIWANGEGLSSTFFSAKPTWEPTLVQGGRTWEDPATGIEHPVIYWGEDFNISATCPVPNAGDTATWSMTATDPTTGISYPQSGTMTRKADGSFTATATAPYPAHDWAQVTIVTNCVNGGGGTTVINFWIDPAGVVQTTNDKLLVGAKVTLYRADTANGVFTVVPDGSDIMSPTNRDNPDFTGQYGNFSWDVIPGFYKVRAEFGNCHAPGNANQAWVESAVYEVPPPVLDIDLRLECPESDNGGGDDGGGTNLPVSVSTFTDWGTGYCANVNVTNNTSQPVDWTAVFTAEGSIYNAWNMNYQSAGNTVTAVGVGWNSTLNPGQSTHSIGFCANRNQSSGGTCNWYGNSFPLCSSDNGGWGWENSQSCISRSLCNSQ